MKVQLPLKADLCAAYKSFNFLPAPIVYSHNNLNLKLILHQDHIEFRGGFITNKVNYTDINQLDVYFLSTKTNNLYISRRSGTKVYIANFKEREQLQLLLKTFHNKDCALSEKALIEIQSQKS